MTYEFARDGYGTAATVVEPDSSHPDIVNIADAELLQTATFQRAGTDLHLHGHDGQHLVIPGYFASAHPAALMAPNGERLPGDSVAQLADQHAEAQPANTANDAAHHAGPYAIGHVDKIVGDVSVQRNGVLVTLHAGDAVYKNDVIQTGGGSSVSISLSDGTALNLVANTHMVLNAYSFDANSDANHALFTLLEGTFAFLAGKAAHGGDMKIATPVAFMNVHEGTTGWAHELSSDEISAISSKLGHVTFSFAVVNEHGSDSHGLYDLLVNDSVVGNIGDPNLVWYLDQDGNLISMPLDHSREFTDGLSRDLIRGLDETNPLTSALGVHGSGSSIDPSLFPQPVNLNALGPSFGFDPNAGGPSFIGNLPQPNGQQGFGHTNIFIWNGFGGWDLTPQDWNLGFAPTSEIDTVIIQSGKSTYGANYFIGSLSVDFGATLNMAQGSLTVGGLTNAGTIAINSSGSDPALVIHGAITLTGGGAIEMLGPTAGNFILGDFAASLVNADNLIEGSGNIGGGDGRLTFINKASVDATPVVAGDSGLLIINTGNAIQNFGVLEATLTGQLQIEDRLFNFGSVEAIGSGSSVVIDNNGFNTGTIEAISGGRLTIQDSTIVNSGVNGAGQIADGLVLAGANSEILLADATILEGFVSVQAGGEIETVAGTGNRIDTTNGTRNTAQPTIVNAGKILINDDSSLTLASPFDIDNAGTIELASIGNATELDFNQPQAILSGGGDIILDGGQTIPGKKGLSPAQDIIDGLPGAGFATVSLENRDNTIAGAGAIGEGDGALAFRNDAQGTVDADLKRQTLVIATGAHTIVNAGLFEATGGGELKIESDLDNSGTVIAHASSEVLIEADVINEDTGKIVARGKNAQVDIAGTSGNKLSVDNFGDIAARHRGTVSLDFTDVTNEDTGRIVAAGRSSLVDIAHSTVKNDGAITARREGAVEFDRDRVRNEGDGSISATGRGSEVSFERSRVENSGEITAERGGEVTFDRSHIDNKKNGTIEADGRGSQVRFEHDRVDNSGLIEAEDRGEVTFDRSHIDNARHGTIEADGRGSKVAFDHDDVDNSGLIEADHHGQIAVDESLVLNDRGGTVEADGRGSNVEFQYDLVGNAGLIKADNRGEVEFDTSVVVNERDGIIEANGRGSSIAFKYDLVGNAGLIQADNRGEVEFDTSLVLNDRDGAIEADGKGSKVRFERDAVGNWGWIGAVWGGSLELAKSWIYNGRGGEIEADGRGSDVDFDRDQVFNAGRIEADRSGEVAFDNSHVDNDRHATIAADGKGSTVAFDRDHVDNFGRIEADRSGEVVFDRSHIDNDRGGTVEANGRGSQVQFRHDHVANSGRIEADRGGEIDFDKSFIVNDSHGIIEADGRGSEVSFGRDHVDNSGLIDATQQGEVRFTRSHVDNDRHGTIEANGRGSQVRFDRGHVENSGQIEAELGGSVIFDKANIDNNGEIAASGGGEVTFEDSHVDNTNGLISASGRDSTVDFDQSHIVGGKLTTASGGLIQTVQGTSTFKDLTITSGTLVDVDGGTKLELTGAIDSSGTISVLRHGELDLVSATVDGGLIRNQNVIDVFNTDTLENLTVAGGDMVVEAHATLHIEKTVYLDGVDVENDGGIIIDRTDPATLVVDDGTAIAGGQLTVNGAGTLDVERGSNFGGSRGAVLDGVSVMDKGAIDIGSTATGAILTLDDDTIISGPGSLTIEAGSKLDVERGSNRHHGATLDGVAVTDDGSLEVSNNATLTLDDGATITGSGKLTVDRGATLDVEKGSTGPDFGAVLGGLDVIDNGAIDVGGDHSGAVLTISGGTDITGGGSGTLSINHGSTLDVLKSATLDGVLVTVDGALDVENNIATVLTLDDGTTIDGNGKLTIESGSTLDVERGTGSAHRGATFDGLAVVDNGSLDIGDTAAAILTLDDGATLSGSGQVKIKSGSTLDVERGATGPGATFDGIAVSAQATGKIEVGQTSTATLSLKNGASITDGTLLIGAAGHTGTLDIESASGATLDGVVVTAHAVTDNIEVGQTGTSTLLLNGGTAIKGGTLAIGAVHSTGTVDVEGASAVTLDGVAVVAKASTDSIKVGQTGNAILLLKDGTTITGGTLALGATGDTGIVDVDSTVGATFHGVTVTAKAAADGIEIGKSGTSTLTLDDGTTMTGGTLTIDADGALQIDPSLNILSGVNVVNHGNIVVDPGAATLELESGTKITGGNLTVGPDGTLDIDNSTLTGVKITDAGIVDIGGGDTFDPTDTLTFSGAGALDIEAGARFNMALSGIDTDDIIDLKGVTVTNAIWDGTHLFLNGAQVDFTISGGLPSGDIFAFKSDNNGGTDLKVATQLVHISAGTTPAVGTEGSPISFSFNENLTGGATLSSYMISGIPVGAVLSDGNGHTFTAQVGETSVDVHAWTLTSLTVTPPNDTNFTLSALVTATDSHGFSYSAETSEAITVDPLSPGVSFNNASGRGHAGTAASVGLAVTDSSEGGANGDGSHNSIESVIITGAPNGVTLTDGAGDHGTVTNGSLDITGWSYGGLTFTAPTNGYYTLTATVTEQDSDGQTSTSVAKDNFIAITSPTITSNDLSGPSTARPADVLTASEGAGAFGVTYQWFSVENGVSHLVGTGATYAVQSSDAGGTIDVVAQISNPNGGSTSLSSGNISVLSPVIFNVANETQLINAINAMSVGGSQSSAPLFQINFTQTITLNSNLPALDLANGSSLVINGNGFDLDGANQYRGLFVFAGSVAIDNLNIEHTLAQGGTGGTGGGGGGAGLGGGLFVGSAAAVSISNVNFIGDRAIGGNGGGTASYNSGAVVGGGGGGMGSSGQGSTYQTKLSKAYIFPFYSSVNGVWTHTGTEIYGPTDFAYVKGGGNGGTVGLTVPGHSGYGNTATGSHANIPAVGSVNRLGSGGFSTRGNYTVRYRGYFVEYINGNVGSHQGPPAYFRNSTTAQNGSFGGGGGGGESFAYNAYTNYTGGGNGGFGGGGGGAGLGSNNNGATGGAGGFGGGGGRSGSNHAGGAGGFGAGHGGAGIYAGGGGGLGAGGGVFVEQGGSLTIAGGSLSGNGVSGGAGVSGGQSGAGFGSGIFIQGNETIILAPAAGDTLTVANGITDQSGSGGTGANAGVGNIEVGGAGVVHFSSVNSYTGTTVVDSGATLDIDSGGNVGAGAITVNGTLNLNVGSTIANALTDNGTINVNAGTTFNQIIHDSGTLNVNAASAFIGGVDGNGVIALDNGGTSTFASMSGTGTLNFGSGVAATALVVSGGISKTITGFGSGDIIDLRSIAATSASLGANNILTLRNSGGTTVGTLDFDPTQTNLQLGVLSDGHGGTLIDMIQTAFSVASATDLAAALAGISQGGADFSLGASYTITFTGGFSLSSLSGQLATINLGSGSTLLVDGADFSLDGGNNGFIDNSAGVTIENLSIANTPGFGIFIEGNHSLTLLASTGQSETISGVIADGGNGNSGSVVIGGGTVTFTAANTYTGGTTVNAGTTLDLAGGSIKAVTDNGNIELGTTTAVIGGAVTGTGTITFTQPETMLKIGSGVPTATIFGIADGDIIDLAGIAATGIQSLGNNSYALTSGGTTLGTLHFDPSQDLASDAPVIVSDGAGGTDVRLGHIAGFTASTAAQLAALITEINIGGADSLANTSYEIDLTGAIALSGNLPNIHLANGDTLSIVGNGHTISGVLNNAPAYAAFNLQSGNLSLSDLTFSQTNGNGSGLNMAAGTSATLSDVIFSDNQAPGGVGGAIAVASGASLTFGAGSLSGDSASAGAAFWLNGGTVNFAPPAGEALTVANSIGGPGGTINISGPGDVVLSGGFDSGSETINISGAGNVTLSGAFFGTQTIIDTGSGTLTIDPTYNLGSISDLAAVVYAIDTDAIGQVGGIDYVINLTADVAAGGGVPAISLAAGNTLTVDTNGHLFDGATNGAGADFTFAATGPGGSTVLTGGAEPIFSVASASDLANAVTALDIGNPLSSIDTNYVIDLTADVVDTAGLPPVTLASGSTLTIHTHGHLFDGATNAAGTDFIFAATGPGGSTVLTGGAEPTFDVASATDLANVSSAIDSGGLLSSINTNYVINLTSDVPLALNPATFKLAAGDTLTIDTGGHLFDGATSSTGSFIFAATGPGGSTVLSGTAVPTFDVGSVTDLTKVASAINAGDLFSSVNTNYVINLTGDVPMTANLPAFNLAAGDTLTINTNGHLYDGATSPTGTITYSTPVAGGSTVLTANTQPTFSVASQADLASVLQAIDNGGFFASTNTNYVIDLTGDPTLTANLPVIALGAGDTLTFEGNGHTIDGGNSYGGFYLRSGNALFSDLTMQHLVERGQNGGFATRSQFYGGGGGGGGGGLGAGGAFFIGSGASATITNVTVTHDGAIGGNGGNGFGGYTRFAYRGGGGVVDGEGYQSGGAGSVDYGGQNGGFGGGGGGAYGFRYLGRHGTSHYGGGAAGYGAGYGGFSSANIGGGGGGGAGLGGGIFVAPGGSLTIAGGETVSGNYVQGGSGGAAIAGAQNGGNGQGLGAGLFAGSDNVTLAPDPGKTLTFSDAIAGDQASTIHIAGSGNVVLGAVSATTIDIDGGSTLTLNGPLTNDSLTVSGSAAYTLTTTTSLQGNGFIGVSGTGELTLDVANTVNGGVQLSGQGTVELAVAGAAGSGPIVFEQGAQATLIVDAAFIPSNHIVPNTILGFLPGNTIDLAGFAANATATLGANNVLTVTDGPDKAVFQLTPGFDFSSVQFTVTSYNGGVAVTETAALVSTVAGQPQNGGTVTLNGVGGVPGSTIDILIDGVQVGTATPNNIGHFSFTTSALADGQYTFTTTQTGNGPPQTTSFIVDVLPTTPSLALASGQTLLVDNAGVQVTGSGEASQTITLNLSGPGGFTATYTTSTSGSGNYSFATPNLAEGHYTLTATDTDGAQVVSLPSNVLSFDVDPQTPTITGVVAQPLDNASFHVTGTAEAGLTVNIFNGGTLIGSGTADANGNFNIATTVPLSHGEYSLTATATDVVQSVNYTSAQSTAFTVDVDPLAPTITSVVGQPVNGGTAVLQGHTNGTSVPNGTITLYENGNVVGTGTVSGTSFTATTVDLADGVHSLTAVVTDASGLPSPISAAFNVTVLPDTPGISSVVATGPQAIEITGTGEAGETVNFFVDGSRTALGSIVVDSTGQFDFTDDVVFAGTHTITASETNTALHLTSTLSAAVQFDVNPDAPTITSVTGAAGVAQPYANADFVVTGTGHQIGDVITLYADGGSTVIGTGTVGTGDVFQITTTASLPADGLHTLTATETAGHDISAPSAGFSATLDPAAVTNIQQNGIGTNHGSIELTGSGQAGDVVTLSIGNAVIGSGTVDSTGHFDVISNANSQLLGGGIQHVTVTETDTALNLTSPAATFDASVAGEAADISSVVSVADPVGRVEVKGAGDAGSTITLYADGNYTTAIGTGTVGGNGQFDIYSSFESLSGGTHNITAVETVQGVPSQPSAAVGVTVTPTPDTWVITSAADLAKAIAQIDVSGAYAQAGAHYTFDIANDLKLTDQLPAFNLAQGASLTINGENTILNANGEPGLFVYSGDVTINNLEIENALTQGGSTDSGGGGGAGLGGGLFIASAGAVTLSGVTFTHDQAVGGHAGVTFSNYGIAVLGGGGGLGGAGGFLGGGGVGIHASGASGFQSGSSSTPDGTGTAAGAGIVVGAASGGGQTGGTYHVYQGGANGGGGGQSVGFYSNAPRVFGVDGFGGPGYGGGIGGTAGNTSTGAGGAGGFGGGGGGGGVLGAFYHAGYSIGGTGGFGGGGGAGRYGGGAGGFGGGGGAGNYGTGGNAGFGAGNGISGGGYSGVGGGGLGAGGAIFVQQGGSLTFAGSGAAYNNSVAGGDTYFSFGNDGSGLGSGIFLQGNETITFAPQTGQTVTISDAIADMTGSNDHTGEIGAGALVVSGPGTLILSGNNTFTGGILLENGTLDVTSVHGAGFGAITLTQPDHVTLQLEAGNGLLPNAIVLDNFVETGESYNNGLLTLTGTNFTSGANETVIIDFTNPGANLNSDLHFDITNGVTTITSSSVAWASTGGGDWNTLVDWTSAVPTAANDVTIASGASAPYTISVAQGELAQAYNLTINDAHATIDDKGILMVSGGLTLAAGIFDLDGGALQSAEAISIGHGVTFEGDGTVSSAAGIVMSGNVIASDAGGPALDFASAVTGSGNFQINAGVTLEFGGSVAGGATVTFAGGTGELKLDAPGSFAATIAGFTGTQADAAHSDVIDLAGINETSANFHESYAGGVLTVTDGINTAELTFSNFNSSFKFASDGNGGTLIFDPPASAAPNAPAASDAPAEPGHNFVFRPGLGAQGPGGSDFGRDTFDLSHFINPPAAQWAQLPVHEDQSHATFDPAHDYGTIAGTTPQHLHAFFTSGVHLH
ncbi:autotransporter-associated beta strand repeat-containing protein [Bradyrhizobium sp. dw_411]|uniref:Ig-like domain-containing protein n=1 Tax=Bradyrhizobium sp. dw_411 TaxID=2720082 RepID=UPI001BCBF69A|nr:autotransporter-associated beta strand repeat-containing protein [Bradyrhizobium sp. dw_411]